MLYFFDIFKDPRNRQERYFFLIVLPILLLIAGATLYFLLKDRPGVESPVRSGVAAVPTASPVLPEPDATPASPSLQIVEQAIPPIQEKKTAAAAPPTPVSKLTRGQDAIRRGDLAAARVFLLEALKSGENKAEVYHALGMLDSTEKHPDRALENFSQAIAADGKNPMYYLRRSEVLRQAGRFKEAVADLSAGRELDRLEPLFSNKIFLTRLEAGEKESVTREVQDIMNLNVTAYQSDWLGAAAAIELQSGNYNHGVAYLNTLRNLAFPFSFNLIITDRFFAPYASRPEMARFMPTESAP